MLSTMGDKLVLAARQRLLELGELLNHGGRLEGFEPRSVLQIDAARKYLHHAFWRLGVELRRGVAGEDDDGHAALAGLGEDVGRQRVGNAEDALGDGVRRRWRDDQGVIDAVIK